MKTSASTGKRFVAFLIDWYLSSLIGSIPVIALQSLQNHDLVISNQLEGLSLPAAWIGCILALGCHFLYYCYIPSKSNKNDFTGQTLGMKWMRLQILTEEETAASLGALTLRHMLFFIVLQGYLTSSNIYLVSVFQMTTGIYVVPYTQTFYYFVILISLGLYFLSKKRQFIQDRLTKTKMFNC